MIHFRNKKGFTLIEVLLALAIIGLVLTPIFVNQSGILRISSGAARLLDQLLIAKKFLLENESLLTPESPAIVKEKKLGTPPLSYTYELKKNSEASSLRKFKNIWFETVSWPDERNKKRQQQLVTFLYRSEKKA